MHIKLLEELKATISVKRNTNYTVNYLVEFGYICIQRNDTKNC